MYFLYVVSAFFIALKKILKILKWVLTYIAYRCKLIIRKEVENHMDGRKENDKVLTIALVRAIIQILKDNNVDPEVIRKIEDLIKTKN